MKKVSRKKPVNKGYRIFSIILTILLVLISFFTVFEIYSLNVLTPMLTVMVIVIFILIDAILALLLIFSAKRIVSKILFSILTIIVTVVFALGGFYMYQANSLLDDVTTVEGDIKNTVSLIVLDSSRYDELEDIDGEKVGVLKSIDAYGTEQTLDDIDTQGVNINTEEFDSIQAEVKALYNGDVEAIVLNETYRDSVTDLEDYSDFNSKTRVLYETVYYTDRVENEAKSVENITSHAFNILISGSDSRGGLAEVARSDVNMIVTVNPETGVILLTSIPRDYYVTTECDPAYGCQVGALDKLTHTGIHGVETTQATIENLLDIEINYTFRVNFTSVVGLVDALGGIDVNVAPGYAVDSFWTNPSYGVTEGVNHLNGEAALAYSRERYAYSEGDRQRVKNQQEVLMAIVKKAISPSMLVNYTSFMQALSGSFETNMSQNEISELIQNQLQNNPSWTFEQYSLDGTGSTEMCAELGNAAYVMIPDENTVQTAKEKIDTVLSGE
ncbi:LCP family protein [Faecalicoccus acidiformans]|uniref:LCP family protein n=1 Tax=Faecalicoccus acidiformans TaxID=915173 RepID=A0ABS2FRH5_9FIRM|nr:LCP family protein [Faecalicoccus acidiformans]MBM6831989.1 LCP family protein [Faecalicoccus acidiformans]